MNRSDDAGVSAILRLRALSAAVLSSTLVAACGGSGGGSSPPPPPAPPPVATHKVGGTVSGLAGTGLVITDNAGDPLALSSDGAFSFTAPVAEGGAYAVAIQSQPPSPAETCVVSSGTGTVSTADVTSVRIDCSVNVHRLGGTVSGLAGSGLVLRESDGDTLAPTADGAFTFATAKPNGSSYSVSVDTQPAGPSQTCTVSSGTSHGTIADADIADVSVVCATNAYSINGVASGLAGAGLVLQDNGSDDLPVAADGGFTFATHVASGAGYKVTVKTQPANPTQICSVGGGTGLVTSGDVASVTLQCATQAYSVRGTVTGLSGSGLVLQDNGADDLHVSAAGSFVFPTGVVSGANYTVTVRTQPSNPTQTCTVGAGATGTIAAADATGVAVVCSTNSYAVGGTVQGLSGTGLVLQDNGGDDVAVAANGAFHFPTPVASGGGYAVTVRSTPDTPRQSCLATHASGTVVGSDVADVQVTCTPSVARFAFLSTFHDSDVVNTYSGSATPYAIDPLTGALGSPRAFVSTGKGGGAVSVTPSGAFAYVPNQQSSGIGTLAGSVSSYRVDTTTGAMTANGPEVAAGGLPAALAIHPSGKFVYVANYADSTLSVFAVAPLTGLLSPVQTAPSISPHSIAIEPGGKFLYVAQTLAPSVGVYTIDGNTGMLTHASDIADTQEVYAVATDPTGRFAFSFDYSTNTGTTGVSSYTIDPTSGALTRVSVQATGVSPRSMVVHPSGQFLYVANYGGPEPYTGYIASGSISVFAIDPTTGQLSVPYPAIQAGRGAGCFAIDPSGKYAWLQNAGTDPAYTPVVTQYAIDAATGALHVSVPDLAVYGCVSVW